MNQHRDPSPQDLVNLRRRAEDRLREQFARPGQSLPTTEEALRLVHELQVHQIELELQNHALLDLRHQFEHSLERYIELYDFAPVSYFTLNDASTIRELNLVGAALLGQERSRLIGRRLGLFVSEQTRPDFNAFLEHVLQGTSRAHCDVAFDREGLPPRHVRLEGVGVRDGQEWLCRLAALDITERKHAEQQRLVAHERLRALMETLPVGVCFSDDTTCQHITGNATLLAQFEMMPQDNVSASAPEATAVGRRVRYFHCGRELRADELPLQRAVAERRMIPPMELEIWLPSGRRWLAEVTGVPLRDTQQQVLCGLAVVVDITERKRAEAAQHALLDEKEVLLREVHHRVKNNLAVIIGLVELQRERAVNPPTASELIELRNRIKSMAFVHEMLYRSGNLGQVDLQGYLQALVGHLRDALDPHGAIQLRVTAPEIWMTPDTAIPCGLIVNELVTNALKYAFPPHRPRSGAESCDIAVAADWDGAAYTLTVADNGIGLPANLDWTTTSTLGLRLVRMLGQHQLGGQLDFDGTRGTRFSLRFGPR